MAIRRQSDPDVAGTPLGRVVSRIYAVDEVIDAGTKYPPQRVSRFTMLLTKSGEARVTVGEHVISHRPGAIVAYAQDAAILEMAGNRSPWHVRYLMLLGPWPAMMTQMMNARNEKAFVYDPAPQRWQRVLNEAIDFSFALSKGWEWQFASRLAELAGIFVVHPSPPGEPKGMLERLESLVDRSPERPWRMPELCEALGVSSSTLSHRFKELAGESPASWVRRRRLEVARRMLMQGLSVVQVSERLGFANPFHFSRAFKAVAGVPPSSIKAMPVDGALHPVPKANRSGSPN
jgi:AraC-like DNA-binding protein